MANLVENVDGLVRKSGPAFLRYRRAMVATWGGVLLDDLTASVHGDGHA